MPSTCERPTAGGWKASSQGASSPPSRRPSRAPSRTAARGGHAPLPGRWKTPGMARSCSGNRPWTPFPPGGRGRGREASLGMKRFIRIGVVTAWPEDDWHSERLLASCARRAEADVIDPAALGTRIDRDEVVVLTGGAPAAAYDAFILARGLGREGDPDVQFEIYRALEGTGALVVNRLDPLLAAQDKFRTSWLLRLAGVPTPRAAVAQTPDDAERALAALGEA